MFAKHRWLTCTKERFKGMPAECVHVMRVALHEPDQLGENETAYEWSR